MSLYVWLLAVFVAVQIGVGLWIGRRLRGASDFFVASRRLPAPLVFATFLAANIGAGSTIGAASLGYRIGLGGWWWNASAGLGSLVFAAWAGPRLWTIARDRGFLTLGDWLEWRYGRAVRARVERHHLVHLAVDSRRPAARRVVDPRSGRGAAAMGGRARGCRRRGDLLRGWRPADLGVGQPGATGRQARGVSFGGPDRAGAGRRVVGAVTGAGPAGRISLARGRGWIAAVVHRAPRAGLHRVARARPERVRGAQRSRPCASALERTRSRSSRSRSCP